MRANRFGDLPHPSTTLPSTSVVVSNYGGGNDAKDKKRIDQAWDSLSSLEKWVVSSLAESFTTSFRSFLSSRSYFSTVSYLSLLSTFSFLSFFSLFSAMSLLSASSFLSIFSTSSALSIYSTSSFLSIGCVSESFKICL